MGCPSSHKITTELDSVFLVTQVSFSLSFEMEMYEISRYGLKVYLKTKTFFPLGLTRDGDGTFP